MAHSISFITPSNKSLKVNALTIHFNESLPHFNVSIKLTQTLLFLVEQYDWFNFHPTSRPEGYQYINRYQPIIFDLSLNEECIEFVKKELTKDMNLLQYLQQQAKDSPLLQTENWSVSQIRQFLPTINAKGKTVDIENTYSMLPINS